MEDDKEKKKERQEGFIQVVKAISDQQEVIREIAASKEVAEEKARPNDEEKTSAELFYYNVFGVKLDFTDVKIPPRPQYDRNIVLLPVEKRIDLNKIMQRNKTECLIRINPVINPELVSSPYNSFHAYMVWVVDCERPDLRIMNQRNTSGKRIMTVEERVLLGLRRFHTSSGEQSRYLDLEMPTLTSSYVEVSKEMKAVVVKFYNGGMYIDVQNIHTPGGAREVFGFE